MPSREWKREARARGVCGRCFARPADDGFASCSSCRSKHRENNKKHNLAGRCRQGCGRPSNGYARCAECYRQRENYKEKRMSEQDLSAYPNFSRGERGGLRWFSGWLPWPAWQKATRTAHTPRPGFRPLVKSAKQYQQFILQAVVVNEFPELPWLREGSEYELHFISFNHKSDNDQHSWGLQDDFVKSGLLADDKSCANTASRRERIPKDQEQRIYIAGWETVLPERK